MNNSVNYCGNTSENYIEFISSSSLGKSNSVYSNGDCKYLNEKFSEEKGTHYETKFFQAKNKELR